ncbi:bifunctional metallophosphatase/5'-nucleotidase [Nocardioides sp. LHG3406-4]|uniref:bifunctional metallophosphatase/5'-nucleotidase n=1 Tax=Nocardioides sp. LHG3406-4 TaxID=2804575 RepID=UPI003CED9C81
MATAAALTAAPLAVVATTAVPAHAAPVDIRLLNINDFHGRIDDNTTKFATTIEQNRNANTLLLSAGDNIGASLFASASQDDNPTIDVLNALEMRASAVGNHEFDKGFTDLQGRVQDRAAFEYLGANVYQKGTTNPALKEYDIRDVGGVSVGIIGAVTQETPSLVSPAGIAAVDFGDPVAAVNRVAGQLTDGNPANGEAQVVVAEYHEGAPDDAGTTSGAFGRIVNETSPKVDVIFTGHTHKRYALSTPRPVVQTGSYGEYVGRVDLSYETTTDAVTVNGVSNVPRVAAAAAPGAFPRVDAVKTIVDKALADAKVVGDTPVGTITADITRADRDLSTPAVDEDRTAESTIGSLVANALRDGVPADIAKPELGLVNPGGLRADLTFAGDTTTNPANTDGVVTYAEANAVLPFVNNIWTIDLTGAQLKKVLEQQWPPAGSSRSYLHMGVSDNVQVTQDPTKPAGQRITAIRIGGKPISMTETYTVSTFSFLGTGGDNFTAFTEGKAKDTGLIDRDLWIKYLREHANLAPNFAREQVVAQGLPASLQTGQKITTNLSKLDVTSKGSVKNTQVQVVRVRDGKRKVMKTVAVTNSSAEVKFTVPGASQVELVALPSKTTLVRDVKKTRPKVTKVKYFPKHTAVRKGAPRINVYVSNADGAKVGGKLKVVIGSKKYFGKVTQGKGKLKLPRFTAPGTFHIKVKYLGNQLYKPAKGSKTIKVYRN